jgi:hypothetical protein
MLVVISVSRQNGSIGISIARPQHSSGSAKTYPSEKEARVVLSAFGINEETLDSHWKMLSQMGANHTGQHEQGEKGPDEVAQLHKSSLRAYARGYELVTCSGSYPRIIHRSGTSGSFNLQAEGLIVYCRPISRIQSVSSCG